MHSEAQTFNCMNKQYFEMQKSVCVCVCVYESLFNQFVQLERQIRVTRSRDSQSAVRISATDVESENQNSSR